MKSQTIYYYTKHVYGVEKIYLSKQNGTSINQAITGLTGRKTLTHSDIGCLKLLGFELERTFE